MKPASNNNKSHLRTHPRLITVKSRSILKDSSGSCSPKKIKITDGSSAEWLLKSTKKRKRKIRQKETYTTNEVLPVKRLSFTFTMKSGEKERWWFWRNWSVMWKLRMDTLNLGGISAGRRRKHCERRQWNTGVAVRQYPATSYAKSGHNLTALLTTLTLDAA